MLNNLPVGVYMPGDSPIHRLRARTKLVLILWLALLFFLANRKHFHFGAFVSAFAVLGLAALVARISAGYLWRRMRFLLLLLAIGVPFTLMWTPGDTWRTFGWVVVTYDGLWFTFSLSAIFLLLYLSSMTLTLTTTPVALAEAIVLLLRPLRWLRLPADEFGMMTLIALRFIPILVEEAGQLIKAQTSRGADFTAGSLAARMRAVGTLLVPLVQGALRRAEHLSSALEARGYGVTGQATLLHEGPLRPLDWLALVAVPACTLLAYWKLF